MFVLKFKPSSIQCDYSGNLLKISTVYFNSGRQLLFACLWIPEVDILYRICKFLFTEDYQVKGSSLLIFAKLVFILEVSLIEIAPHWLKETLEPIPFRSQLSYSHKTIITYTGAVENNQNCLEQWLLQDTVLNWRVRGFAVYRRKIWIICEQHFNQDIFHNLFTDQMLAAFYLSAQQMVARVITHWTFYTYSMFALNMFSLNESIKGRLYSKMEKGFAVKS